MEFYLPMWFSILAAFVAGGLVGMILTFALLLWKGGKGARYEPPVFDTVEQLIDDIRSGKQDVNNTPSGKP